MSVSLVKRYFTVGFNEPGCLPDSDVPATLFATLDEALSVLAYDLDQASEALFEIELGNAREEYDTEAEYSEHFSEVHEDSASIAGSAELIKAGDSDIRWAVEHYGEWSTSEPDDYVYWIQRVTV